MVRQNTSLKASLTLNLMLPQFFFFLLCKMSTKGQINFILIFFMLILGLLVLFRMYF